VARPGQEDPVPGLARRDGYQETSKEEQEDEAQPVIDWGATIWACSCTGLIGLAIGWMLGFRDWRSLGKKR